MLKVVLDTNVIVSGLNFVGGKPSETLDLVVYGDITNCVSSHIITETRKILVRKFKWEEPAAEVAGLWLTTFSELINPDFRLAVITQDDPDNRILECALKAGAEYIITGDHHLLNLQIYQDIKILKPAAFLKIFQV